MILFGGFILIQTSMWKYNPNFNYSKYFGKKIVIKYGDNTDKNNKEIEGFLTSIIMNKQKLVSVILSNQALNSNCDIPYHYTRSNTIVGDLISRIQIDNSAESFPIIRSGCQTSIGVDVDSVVLDFVDPFIDI